MTVDDAIERLLKIAREAKTAGERIEWFELIEWLKEQRSKDVRR